MREDFGSPAQAEATSSPDRRRGGYDVAGLVVDRLARLEAAAAELRSGSGTAPDPVRLMHGVQLLADEASSLASWLRRRLVVDLLERGLTHEQAASALGVSRQRVGRLLADAEGERPDPPRSRLPKAPTAPAAVPAQFRLAEEVLLQAAFDETPHPVLLLDPAGRVISVNRSACETLQRDDAELVGRDYRAWTGEAHVGQALVDHVGLRSGASRSITRDAVWVRRDGGLVPVQTTTHAVRAPRDRRLVGLVVTAAELPTGRLVPERYGRNPALPG